MESIIKIFKQKKILNLKLRENEQKIFNQQVKQCLKQFALIQNYLKDVMKADQFLDDIVEQFEYQEFKEGEIIYKQNDFITDNNYIYFILQGRVSFFEAKPVQVVKSQQKMYQEVQKLRKQIAQLGKNQDYQSTKKYLDQIINLENILQVKQLEELLDICSQYQGLQDYFYSDWKQRQCRFIRKDDVMQDQTIGESDIFANKRPYTCLVVSQVLRTLKIDLKLFNEKFFQKIFQIQFVSNAMKEQLHLFDQNQLQIQKIAELFVLQYFSNSVCVTNEDPKGIYILLYGVVSLMNGAQEIQSVREGEIFGIDDLLMEKRRSSYFVRNEEKAKIYFLKKEIILENKWLVDCLIKVNSQKLQINSINSINNFEISCKKKDQYFDRRFRITEDKLNGHFIVQNTNLGTNKIHQRQKHLHQQIESADEIINNSKKILEKQQQPYIKTFQEQKYLQSILNQQKKINNRIPSLFPGSNEDSNKQFHLFKQKHTKQIGSCSSLDQASKSGNNNKNIMGNQSDINQTPQIKSNNLIESLKIYFNNKRTTQQIQESESSSNSIPLLNLKNNLIQPQVYPLSDEKRHTMQSNARLSLKKLESLQNSPQNTQIIQASNFNFQEELKNSKKMSSKKSFHPIHSQAISQSEPNSGNKKQIFNLDQYLSYMKEQNEISKQQMNFIYENGRLQPKKQSLIIQDGMTNSARLYEDQDVIQQFEEEENPLIIIKNQSAFYSTIKNDSSIFIKQQTKKSLSIDKNKNRRSSSSQNKNKVTIASFINSQSKSLKKLDVFDKNQNSNEEESEDNQQITQFQPQSLFTNQQSENNQIESEFSIRQQSNQSFLNTDKKQTLSLNKFNRTSYIQNIFPDRKDSVSSQNASCYELTTKNSENSSPINNPLVKNRNSQIAFKSKFQNSQSEQKFTISKSTVNLNRDNQISLQNSDTFFEKCITEGTSTTRTQPSSQTIIQQPSANNIQIFKKKKSLNDINEKLVMQLKHKITEYSDKSFLQSINQLKEQKNQITAAIQSELPNLNKVQVNSIQKNKLNILGQLSSQQNQLQNKDFQDRLNANANLFENKVLSELIQKSKNLI